MAALQDMIGPEESRQRQPTMPGCQLKCHLTPTPEAPTGTRKPARSNGLALTTTADKYFGSDRCSMLVSSVMWIIYGKKCVIFSKSLLSGPTCKRWKQHRIFVCYVLSLSFLSLCFLSGGAFSWSGSVCQLVRRNQGKARRNRIHVSAGSAGAGEIRRASPARKKKRQAAFTCQELNGVSSIGVGLQIKAITNV